MFLSTLPTGGRELALPPSRKRTWVGTRTWERVGVRRTLQPQSSEEPGTSTAPTEWAEACRNDKSRTAGSVFSLMCARRWAYVCELPNERPSMRGIVRGPNARTRGVPEEKLSPSTRARRQRIPRAE